MNTDCTLVQYKPLKRRFYILLTFGFYCFLPGFLYNAWMPILQSLEEVFHWRLTEINLLSNMFAIVFVVGIIPFTILWNKVGIKIIYYMSVFVVLFGCFVRLYVGSIKTLGILIQLSNAITGLGSMLALTGPTVISALWFPSNERSRATAFSYGWNSIGGAICPTVASYMVPYFSENRTSPLYNSTHMQNMSTVVQGLYKYIYLQCAMVLLVTLMVLLYFPPRPPIPPCKSSEDSVRIDLLPGLKSLVKNKQFWIVFAINFIVNGLTIGIGAIITSIILPLGLNQKQSGLLLTVTSLFVSAAVFIGGFLGDRFRHKTIVLVVTPITSLLFFVWGLQVIGKIPHDIGSVYAVNIVTQFVSSLVNAILPEMACETAFPVSEEVTTAAMSISLNLGIVVFLSVSMVPNIGVTWVPFCFAVVNLAVLPLLFFYRESPNSRLQLDIVCDEENDDRASLLAAASSAANPEEDDNPHSDLLL